VSSPSRPLSCEPPQVLLPNESVTTQPLLKICLLYVASGGAVVHVDEIVAISANAGGIMRAMPARAEELSPLESALAMARMLARAAEART
jgi:hypothetical protein